MKRSIASSLVISFVLLSTLVVTLSVKAQQETIVFQAQLLAGNEVAPTVVHPTERGASGTAIVTLVVTRTGGNITAATATFDFALSGLAPNSLVILAHIHEGAANVNGPVRVDSGLSPPGIPASGGFLSISRSGLAVTPAIAQGIINNPGGWYFNVHTELSPGGVARGQLERQQVTPGPVIGVPTLSEWGIILMTLIFIAVCTFFLAGRSKTALSADHMGVLAAPVASIDWRLLARVTVYVEAIIALALVVLRPGLVDVIGSLASGLVAAFTIHLLIRSARR